MSDIMVIISDGYVAPKPFYDHIKALIEEVIPYLIPEGIYTAKMLCGPEFWDSLNGNEPALAGRCVFDMVRKEILPLRVIGCEHQYPKRYTLK